MRILIKKEQTLKSAQEILSAFNGLRMLAIEGRHPRTGYSHQAGILNWSTPQCNILLEVTPVAGLLRKLEFHRNFTNDSIIYIDAGL